MPKTVLDHFLGILGVLVVFFENVISTQFVAIYNFPNLALGYLFTWVVYLGVLFLLPDLADSAKVGAMPVEKGMRKLFFVLTFLSIGVITNFKKLAEAKFGKMVFVYLIALFVFIVPVAIVVGYIFHHGMTVPVVTP